MGVSYNPKIVTDGLVFCVDAANSRSYPKTGTTWTDLAGANNGTLTNMDASNFDEANGGSLVFDGTNEYVNNTSFSTFNTANGSIGIWTYPDSTGGNDQMIVTAGGTQTFGGDRIIRIFYDEWSFATYGSNNQDWNYIAPVSFNSWNYVVGTWEGTSLTFYVNLIKYSNIKSGVITPLGSVFRMGAAPWSIVRLFKGEISLVQLYNRALTADEVRQNYNATKGRYE